MSRAVPPIVPLLLLAALAACGRTAEPPDPSVRVVARVNGDAISMRGLDGLAPGAGADAARAPLQPDAIRALDRLIDQELLVQEALATRLDREPQVAQAIATATRQVLAQARLERTIAGAAKCSAQEIPQFYRAH